MAKKKKKSPQKKDSKRSAQRRQSELGSRMSSSRRRKKEKEEERPTPIIRLGCRLTVSNVSFKHQQLPLANYKNVSTDAPESYSDVLPFPKVGGG